MSTRTYRIDELIAAASRSEKAAVKKALNKLEFAIRMSHTEDEILDLIYTPRYHIRIGHKLEKEQYVYTIVQWQGDAFAVMPAGHDENAVISGYATLQGEKEPAIVYLNKPRLKEKRR